MNRDVPRHQRPTKLKKFLFGCEYYPDHWSEQDKLNDPQWMAEAGLNGLFTTSGGSCSGQSIALSCSQAAKNRQKAKSTGLVGGRRDPSGS